MYMYNYPENVNWWPNFIYIKKITEFKIIFELKF